MHKIPLVILTLGSFLMTSVMGPICQPITGASTAFASDEFHLPAPGVMVHLSPPFDPPILKGIKVHPDNPFRFDFILDQGDSPLKRMSSPNAFRPQTGHSQLFVGDPQQEQLKTEATKLIKYFLVSLTIPEKDLWVNLSPYEKDRVIPQSFGLTEMGRDLLAEDYMLKQITASLIYPEDVIGKKFWKRIYEKAARKYGTTNVPVSTFNKVWIVPEKAVVYENAKTGTAYVEESKLKVMLEQDYLALSRKFFHPNASTEATSTLGSQIIREIVIPELTIEVNENKNFAKLRQIYNSLILAVWYKKKIKDSILNRVYSDRNKISGVNMDDPKEKQKIYQRYLQAFKKGVYNYIKEEQDPLTQEIIPRKYFSGGMDFAMSATSLGIDGTLAVDPNDLFLNGPSIREKMDNGSLITIMASLRTFHRRPADKAMGSFSQAEKKFWCLVSIGVLLALSVAGGSRYWNQGKVQEENIKKLASTDFNGNLAEIRSELFTNPHSKVRQEALFQLVQHQDPDLQEDLMKALELDPVLGPEILGDLQEDHDPKDEPKIVAFALKAAKKPLNFQGTAKAFGLTKIDPKSLEALFEWYDPDEVLQIALNVLSDKGKKDPDVLQLFLENWNKYKFNKDKEALANTALWGLLTRNDPKAVNAVLEALLGHNENWMQVRLASIPSYMVQYQGMGYVPFVKRYFSAMSLRHSFSPVDIDVMEHLFEEMFQIKNWLQYFNADDLRNIVQCMQLDKEVNRGFVISTMEYGNLNQFCDKLPKDKINLIFDRFVKELNASSKSSFDYWRPELIFYFSEFTLSDQNRRAFREIFTRYANKGKNPHKKGLYLRLAKLLSVPHQSVPRREDRLEENLPRPILPADNSMVHSRDLGGIDLTLAGMDVQTRMEGTRFSHFYIDAAMLQQLLDAPGFEPEIIDVRKTKDLRQFLDLPDEVNTGKLP